MRDRITDLQRLMMKEGITYYIVTTSDAHMSEYVSPYDCEREWISGFTGSNGDLLVTSDGAYLWTDGRYFVQAEKELEGSGIELMRIGEKNVPTLSDYLKSLVKPGDIIGLNGVTFTYHYINMLEKKLEGIGCQIKADIDLIDRLWKDRPERSAHPVIIHEMQYAGIGIADKLYDVRKAMADKGCQEFFLSRLDDIMWLFNIRGNDVECNPVALSYALVSSDRAYLFLQKKAVDQTIINYLKDNDVILLDYDNIIPTLSEYRYSGRVLLDDRSVSYTLYNVIAAKTEICQAANPTTLMKAVKNDIEIANMKDYFLKDSLAMTHYLYWLKKVASNNCVLEDGSRLDELKAARYCDSMREAVEGFMGLSFTTISAYGPNGAMMHYEAGEGRASVCEPKGMLLTDCGGQYPGATTDVTRTVAMGPVSDEEKRSYTRVLKGFLALMYSHFLEGCTGRNLDILARGPLWKEGIDYKCGTGHGVGYCLNVHEGPQNIRWKYNKDIEEAVLEPGMLVTDEPGVYIADKYGIRTENTLLVVEKEETGNGRFLGFEPLTIVPLDPELIDYDMLNSDDIELLGRYNTLVYDRLSPYLEEDEKKWLRQATFTK